MNKNRHPRGCSTNSVPLSSGASSLQDDDDDDDRRMMANTIRMTTTNDNDDDKGIGSIVDVDLDLDLDWDDRIGLQAKWTNEAKGWKVAVEWRQTESPVFGTGLFAAQDIRADTVLRVGTNGRNLLPFRCIADIEAFCSNGDDDNNGNDNDNVDKAEALYRSRLLYVKDYLWGFNPNADERGYDNDNDNDAETLKSQMEPNRFFGMWVPGNGLNHNCEPNTVYRHRPAAAQDGTDTDVGINSNININLVALRDLEQGEELFDDYRRHGKAPQWLLEFAKEYNVTLNFANCNDFVVNHHDYDDNDDEDTKNDDDNDNNP
jgi:hypothetical protein